VKRWILVGLLLALILPLGSSAQAYIETFDSPGSAAEWLNYSMPSVIGNLSGYNTSGGSTLGPSPGGGYIYGSVDNSGTRLYTIESSASSFSSLVGQTLTVDYKTTGSVDTGAGSPMVRFFIGNTQNGQKSYYVSSNTYSWNPNTDLSWTTHAVAVDGNNFALWTLNSSSNPMLFDLVAASPTNIGLVFTYGNLSSNDLLGFTSAGGATISIDNFYTPNSPVPIPAALWLLGSGLVGLVGLRRKMKR